MGKSHSKFSEGEKNGACWRAFYRSGFPKAQDGMWRRGAGRVHRRGANETPSQLRGVKSSGSRGLLRAGRPSSLRRQVSSFCRRACLGAVTITGNSEQGEETADLLRRTAEYLRRLPPAVPTMALIRDIERHLASPTFSRHTCVCPLRKLEC